MTQDNDTQQDTPQTNQEYASLEEAVFGEGSDGNVTGAFTSDNEGNTEPAPQGQPAVGTEENAQVPTQTNNDETRYQYWQSQADKYKNELATVKQQAQQVRQQEVQRQTPVQPEAPAQEAFPPPPNKPQKPRAFNREEAYSDPSSESSRYVDELEGWRDDMNEYNSLKSEYNSAVIEDKFNQMETQRVDNIKRAQARHAQSQQVSEIKSKLTGHYGMQDGEATDFMKKMSDPNSITIDNLVQLYRLQGSGNAQQPPQSAPTPSAAFTQTQNAQQVPSPMGVMPSGNTNTDGRTFEDKIMYTMIGNFDSNNPWK